MMRRRPSSERLPSAAPPTTPARRASSPPTARPTRRDGSTVSSRAKQPRPAQRAPPADEGYLDELEQLSKLHEEGVLTDEEFDAKKKEILGI